MACPKQNIQSDIQTLKLLGQRLRIRNMIKNILIFALIIGCIAFGGESLRAQLDDKDMEGIDHLVVAELFTSQSCSSCPPADEILTQIAKNPNIITLGFHVTYWDHLHWKDTLGRELASDRQRSYAAHFKSRRVYTPQMIVNGSHEFVGNHRQKAISALDNADAVMPLTLNLSQKTLKISAPSLIDSGGAPQTYWLFGVKNSFTQAIPSGENKGRSITYTNAVLFEREIKNITNKEQFSIETPDWRDIDSLVLIAQESRFGKIIAAGRINL